MNNHEKLHEAIIFAALAHKGQTRKGSDVDYITHPMEVLQILTSMNADDNLLIAGVLHDTAEDTDVSLEDLFRIFGEDVATLVAGHTEDPAKPWDERRLEIIKFAEKGSRRLKMLVLADLVSNLRSTLSDYKKVKDKLWNKFSTPRVKRSWYYSAVLDAIEELQNDNYASRVYWEATDLYKDIFVKYYINQEETMLFQITEHGENAYLQKDTLQWESFEDKAPGNLVSLSRERAEEIEDSWIAKTRLYISDIESSVPSTFFEPNDTTFFS